MPHIRLFVSLLFCVLSPRQSLSLLFIALRRPSRRYALQRAPLTPWTHSYIHSWVARCIPLSFIFYHSLYYDIELPPSMLQAAAVAGPTTTSSCYSNPYDGPMILQLPGHFTVCPQKCWRVILFGRLSGRLGLLPCGHSVDCPCF